MRLEQNYRSTQRILSVADALIRHNLQRKPKRLFTDNDEGAKVRYVQYATGRSEADDIAAQIAEDIRAGRRRPRDFAIFYRINALSRSLESALREHGVPYQMVNGLEFYQRKEIKDILGYLGLLNNPRDDVAFERVVNTPVRGVGRKTLDRLRSHAARYSLSLLAAAADGRQIEGLSARARGKLQQFVLLYERLSEHVHEPVEEIVGHVLSYTSYEDEFGDPDSEDDRQRLANIRELLTAAREFDAAHEAEGGLEQFLEESCLVNEIDSWETENDSVTLMTLHAAKGLEFPVVRIIALEEGILPHRRSEKRNDQIEEERRLLFVGVTRAQEELQLSRAARRLFQGAEQTTIPSSFLSELPKVEMDWRDAAPAPEAVVSSGPARGFLPRNPADYRPQLTTADQLLTGSAVAAPEAPRMSISPEVFVHGMIVTHPEHGLGKIVALSGTGQRRQVTVAFASGAGERKFILAHSPLRPAGK